jgi:hypothetical protein
VASRKEPYAEVLDPALLATAIREGEREDIPDDCPRALRNLIEHCWAADVDARPTAKECLEVLRKERSKEE